MMVQRGMRDKLDKYLNPSKEFEVEMSVSGSAVYDYCCFGVDGAGKLSDDRYMVFYNQPQSPNKEIKYSASNNGAKFTINLSKLANSINKLVFTVSIDGSGTMGDISSHNIVFRQGLGASVEMTLGGKDFHSEKAIISVEVYKKDSWRFAAVASGFNGGLGDLLRAYGGEELSGESTASSARPPAASNGKVSLEKKLQKDAPQLVSLAKPLAIELEKRNLQDCVARVALVLDISGSMSGRYSDGTVQEIVNKALPLAVQFDDDGELDFWYYGSRPKRMPSVNMKNYKTAVPRDWNGLMESLGYGNTEPLVMNEVVAEYKRSKLPAYVIFITDGGVGELYRNNGEWKFNAIGSGFQGGLKSLCQNFGVNV